MSNKFPSLAIGFLLIAAPVAASADSCSGHAHTTGTVLGAVGGGVLGGAITHGSLVGVAGGAVAGGLAGNAISRSADCRHHYYSHRYYRHRYSERYRHSTDQHEG